MPEDDSSPEDVHGAPDVDWTTADPVYGSSGRVEEELVAVLGQKCHALPDLAAAHGCIFGVTVGNDVTGGGYQWMGFKGEYSTAVLGPWVTTGVDWTQLTLSLHLQDAASSTVASFSAPSAEHFFYPEDVVEIMSQSMVLLKGDLLFMLSIRPFTSWSVGWACTASISQIGELVDT